MKDTYDWDAEFTKLTTKKPTNRTHWRKKDGSLIKYCDMEDSHVINTFRLVSLKLLEFKDCVNADAGLNEGEKEYYYCLVMQEQLVKQMIDRNLMIRQ